MRVNEIRRPLSRYITGGEARSFTGNWIRKLLNAMTEEGLLICHAPIVSGAAYYYTLAPNGEKFLEEARNSNKYPEIFQRKDGNPGHSGSPSSPDETNYSDIQNLIAFAENADRTSLLPDTPGSNHDTGGFSHGLPFTSPGKGRTR